MLKDRISSARACLGRSGVEAVILFHLSNIRYLAGFTGSDGAFVLAGDDGWFLTDSRYTTQAAEQVSDFPCIEYRGKLEGVSSLVKEKGFRKVGFEAEHTTVSLFKSMAAALPGVELVPIGADFDELRTVKDSEEVRILEKCAGIASAALVGILDMILPGAVERDVALALEFAMRRAGADDKSFDFIVASGSRGALPHGKASSKIIQQGELVTLDFGAVYQGYCSDETVTVSVGKPDAKLLAIYNTVKEAHDLAMEAVKPGTPLREIDSVARNYIADKGYGHYFGHGLGHGVGLEIHEKPVVSPKSDRVAEEGMVFTIEPGIYIPELGGVRIEDTVVVTASGCRPLTKVSKELKIL